MTKKDRPAWDPGAGKSTKVEGGTWKGHDDGNGASYTPDEAEDLLERPREQQMQQQQTKVTGPKQLEVPGTERKRIKPLDAAIAGIIEAKAIQKSEKERAEKYAASVQRLLEEHDIPVYRYIDDSGKPFTARKQSKDRIVVKEEKKGKAGKLDTWKKPGGGGGKKRLGADQTKKRRAPPAGAN